MFTNILLEKLVRPSRAGGGLNESYNQIAQDALNRNKQQLYNKYYAPNIESEIAQRHATTLGQNIFNQFAPDKYRYEMENAKTQAEKNRLVNKFIQDMAGGGNTEIESSGTTPEAPQPGTATTFDPNKYSPYPPLAPGSEQGGKNTMSPQEQMDYFKKLANRTGGVPSEEGPPPGNTFQNQQPIPPTPAPPVNPLQKKQLTYPQAAFMSNVLGLGKPTIVDIDGKKVAITPFGNIDVAQGLTPGEKERQKGMGKYSSEFYKQNVDAYTGLQNQNLALDEIIGAIENNPEFSKVTGPIGSRVTTWMGNPKQRELLGTLQSASGEITLQIAPALKGAFTGRDQSLIKEIKANPQTDFPDVFIGKLKAQKLINMALTKRAELAAKYSNQGMAPLDAAKLATKQTPLEKYRPYVEKLIKGNPDTKISIINRKTGQKEMVTREEARKRGVKNV